MQEEIKSNTEEKNRSIYHIHLKIHPLHKGMCLLCGERGVLIGRFSGSLKKRSWRGGAERTNEENVKMEGVGPAVHTLA